MEQINVRPHLTHAKPGGMMDAINKDRFIEFLADKWPERKINIPVKDYTCEERMNNEGEIEDQSNDPNYPWKG